MPELLSADQIRTFRERLGLTQADAALLVGVDQRTWQKWEYGERAMQSPTVRLLLLIEKFPQARRFLEQLR